MCLYKKFISIAISIVLLFSLTACDGTESAYIYFYLNEQPKTVDPQTAKSDVELMLVRNIFEGLLRIDENGKLVIKGEHEFVGEISEGLKKRLIENGMPQDWLDRICRGEAVEC